MKSRFASRLSALLLGLFPLAVTAQIGGPPAAPQLPRSGGGGGFAMPSAEAPKEIRQWTSDQGGGMDFSTQVIRTKKDWDGLWQSIGKTAPCKFHPWFESAVVIHLGYRAARGYRPLVRAAADDDNQKFVVQYSEGAPAGTVAGLSEGSSQPWVIALVDPSSNPIVFRRVRD